MSYDDNYFLSRESWRDWRIEALELLRLARVEPETCVLDLGCGGGGLLRLARERGASVVGVDTLDVALRLAEKRVASRAAAQRRSGAEDASASPLLPRPSAPLLSFIQIGTDNLLPFKAKSFHAILGQHVIEHIADVDTALREWHRLLKPGGRVAMATPNVRYPDAAHFADDDHKHIFSPAELRATFARAGFVVEECFTAFPLLLRIRIMRGVGVIGYDFFRRVPYWAARGRTILIGARKI